MDKTYSEIVGNSHYLSSSDLIGNVVLTIKNCTEEVDKNAPYKKEVVLVANFIEGELRPGYKIKSMRLNATNCKTLWKRTKSNLFKDWNNLPVTIYAQDGVKNPSDGSTGYGLRISPEAPRIVEKTKPELTPSHKAWGKAVEAFKRDQNHDAVLKRMVISDANKQLIKEQADEQG